MSENRFENANEETYRIMNEIREAHFPELNGCEIKIVFDNKKRISGGKLTIGSLQKPNEMVKFFTTHETGSGSGYDYIMRLDKVAWDVMEEEDKKRLIRHELRHSDVDFDKKNPYNLMGHTIEDFYEEVELNQTDPRWAQRVVEATAAEYERIKEEQQQG